MSKDEENIPLEETNSSNVTSLTDEQKRKHEQALLVIDQLILELDEGARQCSLKLDAGAKKDSKELVGADEDNSDS